MGGERDGDRGGSLTGKCKMRSSKNDKDDEVVAFLNILVRNYRHQDETGKMFMYEAKGKDFTVLSLVKVS